MSDLEFLAMLEARCVETEKIYGGPRRVSLNTNELARLFDIRSIILRYRRGENFMVKQLRKQIEMARDGIAQRVAKRLIT